MRDLDKDLEICDAVARSGCPNCEDGPDMHGGCSICGKISEWVFAQEARTGWPYAIRRAMEAEAEVDRLRNELEILQEQLEQRGCKA